MFFQGMNPASCRRGHSYAISWGQFRSSTSRGLATQPQEKLFLSETFSPNSSAILRLAKFIRPVTGGQIFPSLRVQADNPKKCLCEERTCARAPALVA